MDKLNDALEQNIRTQYPVEGTETLLQLDEEQLKFFQTATGIEDVDALRAHIIAVQRAAYAVKPYPCIASFYFTDFRLVRVPAYERLLELGRTRKNPIYLEVGCCFGQAIRKAIADGYPRDCVIATDVVPEFWDMGHKLFRTTQETYPVPFVPGDALEPAFLEPIEPFYTAPSTEPPALSSVKTLNELRGHVSAVGVGSVFHLFDEDTQLRLARALACLLSPEPGSMLLGLHVGNAKKGVLKIKAFNTEMFAHSPESWTELWDGGVFKKGSVRVEARLQSYTKKAIQNGVASPVNMDAMIMEWSVTRL